MAFKYKKTIIALIIALALGLLLAGSGVLTGLRAQAKGPAIHSQEDVVKFWLDGEYPEGEDGEVAGFSNLVRKSDGIQMQLKTSDLKADGVYTYWWLADDPDVDNPLIDIPFDLVVNAGYTIVKKNGKTNDHLTLGTGAAGIEGNPFIFMDVGNDGLTNPYNAGIEVELVYHGTYQAWEAAGFPDEWITTPFIGDESVCNIELGHPDLPEKVCPLAQLTFHAP